MLFSPDYCLKKTSTFFMLLFVELHSALLLLPQSKLDLYVIWRPL